MLKVIYSASEALRAISVCSLLALKIGQLLYVMMKTMCDIRVEVGVEWICAVRT
jgi:hypothetical protein